MAKLGRGPPSDHSPCDNTVRQQTIYSDSSIDLEPSHDRVRNVIIFGECGVGKSSLINLLAGEQVCETSSGALGCTLEYKRYSLDLDHQRFAIWDTAGLDEGSQGSVPAEKAEAYLKQLLHDLVKNNGIDLLVYCVRGTRVRSALLANYHIFYSAICRKRVPISIVITGLENQEESMETWWRKNERQFSSLKMYFDGHACVTTLGSSSVKNTVLEKRREESKAAVINMITSTCRSQRWKPPERSWIDSAFSDIRAMLSPRDGFATRRFATIIMCEASRNCSVMRSIRKRSISFKNPVVLSLSFNPFSFRSPVSISSDISISQNRLPFEESLKSMPEHQYHVYQVPRKPTSSDGVDEETKKVMVVKRGADLLIFCVEMEETDSGSIKSQWEHFNFTYGGDLSPQIVVVVGAQSHHIAEEWWKDAVGGILVKHDVNVTYWPTNAAAAAAAEVGAARTRLRWLINNRCIDCSWKVTPTRNGDLFKRPPLLDMSSLTALWVKPESNAKEDGPPSPEQDILTKWGVWRDVARGPYTPTLASPRESME